MGFLSYITNSTSLFLTFRSNGDTTAAGFVIDYEGKHVVLVILFIFLFNFGTVLESDGIQQCSGVRLITNSSGYIQDHTGRVGSNYSSNANCGFLIDISNTVGVNSRVQLSFGYFNLSTTSVVRVFDGKSPLVRKCLNDLMII